MAITKTEDEVEGTSRSGAEGRTPAGINPRRDRVKIGAGRGWSTQLQLAIGSG
jgi:hypothetical protein